MKRGVILLVEDQQDDVDLTLRAFSRSAVSHEIVTVRDGQEALDFLFTTGRYAGRDRGLLPSVVLLDLKLPKVNGLEVLRRIRADERTRLIPVVVLTSSSEDRDILDCYGGGANSFICKPVNFSEFINTANELGRYWLEMNQPVRVA
jgi:two-component system, response regulator